MTRVIALFSAATVLVGLAAGFFIVLRGAQDDLYAECRRSSVAGGTADIGGPFTLTAADGRRLSEADVITGPTLIYFGYGFCPDFCPMDLARNAEAADTLADEGVEVEQVFVTVDPARDTPEAIGAFTEAIHPDLLGLTGTEAETAAAANAYRVYFRRGEGDDAFYLVDHSTFTYLMAPGPGFLEFYPSDAPAEAIAESVACFAERL